MADWSRALDAQLDLIRWWRSDDGLAYGTYLAAPGLGSPEAKAAGNFARAMLAHKRDSTLDTKKLLADWPQYEPYVKTGFEFAYDVANVLDGATTYFVSEEMGRFLLHAHEDLPPHAVAVDDIPVPTGFVYFAEPLEFDTLAIRVLHWHLYEKIEPPTVDMAAFCEGEQRLPYPALMKVWPTGQPANSTLAQLLQAFWILSGQRIAKADSRPVERHSRKRAERAGFSIPEDGIRVVTLRRPETGPTPASGLVDWSHRWIVSGHWRNQWYPSQEEHRPKWIDAYEKGPDDKPLVLNDRVYRWVR